MSSRKRPLSEIQNSQTPTRYVPSTPHAIQALQQRSGAKTRSTHRRRRAFSDTLRPDSARGILRRLAKITAPLTKKTVQTPATAARGKENLRPDDAGAQDGDDDNWGGNNLKRPRLNLDVDDSLEDLEAPHVEEEEEDSELPAAPTPSILPDQDEHDPTITFKSIQLAHGAQPSSERIDRRKSRASFRSSIASGEDDVDDDLTILGEMGRRAISEEPTGRLSRYSFGSLRMSDFGSELEIRRDSDHRLHPKTLNAPLDEYSGYIPDYVPIDFGGETEHLEQFQRPASLPPPDEDTVHIPTLDETFQFELVDKEASSNYTHGNVADKVRQVTPEEQDEEVAASGDFSAEVSLGIENSSEQPVISEEVPQHPPRRKKLKMTRHGLMVPAMPSSMIRRVATEAQARLGNRKPKLGRDHMQALEQATEWFFEQMGEDLEAYSGHARRKKRVDRRDVLMLMQRQRVLQGDGELQKAAQELLPEDLAADFEGFGE